MPVYLHLFHGRDDPDADMDNDWGFDGPVLGPSNNFHVTYNSDIKFDTGWLIIRSDGLIYYAGAYYGDWSVFDEEILQQNPSLAANVQEFNTDDTREPDEEPAEDRNEQRRSPARTGRGFEV